MSEPEVTVRDAIDQDASASSDEATADTSTEEAPAGIQDEAWEEEVTADYQTRLREFDEVDSVPVESLPAQSSQLGEDDLQVKSPSSPNG